MQQFKCEAVCVHPLFVRGPIAMLSTVLKAAFVTVLLQQSLFCYMNLAAL